MAKAVQLKDKNGNKVFAASWMPIGSIYISVNNTNPSTYFGGTWERIEGRFLLAADDSTYTLGATGGSATSDISHQHNLSDNGGARIGLVKGKMYYNRDWLGENVRYNQTVTNVSFNHVDDGAYTGNVTTTLTGKTDSGGNNSLNIMPPYLVVYIWKRVE